MTDDLDETQPTTKSIDESNERQRQRVSMSPEATEPESSSEQAENEQERQLETGEESPA